MYAMTRRACDAFTCICSFFRRGSVPSRIRDVATVIGHGLMQVC